MTELAHYQQGGMVAAPQPVQTSGALDSWVSVMSDVIRLSEYICQTEFVPEAMRNKPAAVAAAMLTGREMGIEPMMALRHIHVVKGKPGLSAELMRAQVLAKGHEIDYLETTDTRCVVAGRRRGESEWTRVTFTADQAKRAKIDLGGYPEDKLLARATTRLCRRKFADVVAGLAAVDELEDGVYDQPSNDHQTEAPKQAPKARTAQRRQATATVERKANRSTPRPAAQEPAAAAGPPLPGEDDYDEPKAPEPESEPAEDSALAITSSQMRKLHAIFSKAGNLNREDRLRICKAVVNRDELTTSSELTKDEASALIDTLEMVASNGDLTEDVEELLNAVALVQDEQAQMAAAEADGA